MAVAGALLAATGCGSGAQDAERAVGTDAAAHRRPVLCDDLRARVVGRVRAPAATELSGLVLSRTRPGVLWTHNDSGDAPRLLAIGLDGRLLADVAVSGAAAFDWEDIAAGPRTLYAGDIGDNVPQRETIVVYRVREPAPGATTAPASRLELRYPDGRHDAEALLRDPASGELVVVTKTRAGRAGIYAARPQPNTTTTLRRRGRLAVRTGEITAGDVSADGSTIALRSYDRAFVWRRRAGESVAAALRRRPCTAGARLLAEGQGEALALGVDGRSLLTVPEGPEPAIRRYVPRS